MILIKPKSSMQPKIQQ